MGAVHLLRSSQLQCSAMLCHAVGNVAQAGLWLALAGSGWLWMALAGSGVFWVALGDSGWLWVIPPFSNTEIEPSCVNTL